MKIPYGLSHFPTVIKENYAYIDKTVFIHTLENEGRHNVLLRPRRFGKSLFLSMLQYYYDVNEAAAFNALFGNLAIGKSPTPNHNQYQILFLEFSGIVTNQPEEIYRGFSQSLEIQCQGFLRNNHYPEACIDAIRQFASPADKIRYIFTLPREHKLYLLIDEYDHFANSLMADDLDYFRTIVGKGGFVRAFYEVLKAGTQQGVIDRLFITGVTPVMLDNLTSGFNVIKNLSLNTNFNEVIGFTRSETEFLLQPLMDLCHLEPNELMQAVTQWYNGYCFSEDECSSRLYNSDMVLYFIDNFNKRNCSFPHHMLDENIASDYGKILALFKIGDRDKNYEVLDTLINEGYVVAKQRRKFDFDKGFDRDDFVNLLYYMGFVALAGYELSYQRFVIPNYVIKVLYFEYFKVELERKNQITISNRTIEQAIVALALNNTIEPLRLEIERVLQALSNRDFMNFDEKHIKMLIVTLLYQSESYFIQSEPEVNQKYPDILLLERSPFAVKHEHLIELKFCKQSDRKKNAKLWAEKLNQGIEQVQGYLELPALKDRQKLSAWVILTDGEEVVVEQVLMH